MIFALPFFLGLVLFVCFFWIRPLRLAWYSKLLLVLLCFLAPGELYLHYIIGGELLDPNLPWNLFFLLEIANNTLIILAGFVGLRLLINCCYRLFKRKLKVALIPAQATSWALLFFVLSSVIAIYGTISTYAVPQLKQYMMTMEKLDPRLDGLTIIQISDLHINATTNPLQLHNMIQSINALKPDLVFITGDIVDGRLSKRQPYTNMLFRLKSTFGTYFVSGNHEYYSNYTEWQQYFVDGGMHSLDNKALCLRDANGKALFNLGGITDPMARRYHLPLPEVEAVTSSFTELVPTFMLSHRPDYAHEIAKSNAVDIIFAGHTHGGLIKPLAPLVARLNGGYVSGYYDVNGTPLIVNNGVMSWMLFRMRLGVPAQIVSLKVKSKHQDAPNLGSLTSHFAETQAQQELTTTETTATEKKGVTTAKDATTELTSHKNVNSRDRQQKNEIQDIKGIQLILPMHDTENDTFTQSVTNLAVLPTDLSPSQLSRIDAILNEKQDPLTDKEPVKEKDAAKVPSEQKSYGHFSLEELRPVEKKTPPAITLPQEPKKPQTNGLTTTQKEIPAHLQAQPKENTKATASNPNMDVAAYSSTDTLDNGAPDDETLEIQAVYSISLNPDLVPSDESVSDLL